MENKDERHINTTHTTTVMGEYVFIFEEETRTENEKKQIEEYHIDRKNGERKRDTH